MMLAPIDACTATSNICRGISERIFAATSRPRYIETERCTITDSASTRSPLIRMSSFTTSAARNSLNS